MIGQRFGRWLVVICDSLVPGRGYHYLCRCECGNERVVSGSSLRSGRSKSCGCRHKEIVTKHGYNGTRTYKSYHAMKERCLNSNHVHYDYYGGRGITICDRWLESFENFLEDMGERPKATTLDRKDGNLGYYKDNCKWSTLSEQNKNKRYQ